MLPFGVTGAIKGTSQNTFYSEIGLESFKFKCWFRKLYISYRIKEICVLRYLFDHVPETDHLYNTRSSEDVRTFYRRTDAFQYSFFQL